VKRSSNRSKLIWHLLDPYALALRKELSEDNVYPNGGDIFMKALDILSAIASETVEEEGKQGCRVRGEENDGCDVNAKI
jgi:hypothetical protein